MLCIFTIEKIITYLKAKQLHIIDFDEHSAAQCWIQNKITRGVSEISEETPSTPLLPLPSGHRLVGIHLRVHSIGFSATLWTQVRVIPWFLIKQAESESWVWPANWFIVILNVVFHTPPNFRIWENEFIKKQCQIYSQQNGCWLGINMRLRHDILLVDGFRTFLLHWERQRNWDTCSASALHGITTALVLLLW